MLFLVMAIPILKLSSIFPAKVFEKSSGREVFCDTDISSPVNSSVNLFLLATLPFWFGKSNVERMLITL